MSQDEPVNLPDGDDEWDPPPEWCPTLSDRLWVDLNVLTVACEELLEQGERPGDPSGFCAACNVVLARCKAARATLEGLDTRALDDPTVPVVDRWSTRLRRTLLKLAHPITPFIGDFWDESNVSEGINLPTGWARVVEELEEFIWAVSVIDDTDLGLGERPSWKSDTEHTRDSSRGARIHSWLVDYLRAHQGDYGKLKDRILSSDSSAIEEFRKLFGPTALARRFAEHDGASGDDWQLASSRTLIKRSPLYKSRIQPLLNGKEPKEEDRERRDTIEDLLDRAQM